MVAAIHQNDSGSELLPAEPVGKNNADELYAVTLRIKSNKIELDTYGVKGKTKYSHFLNRLKVKFVPEDENLPPVSASLGATSEQLAAHSKKWIRRWQARLLAGLLWFLYASYLFFEKGLLGKLLLATLGPTAAGWELWLLIAISAGLLVASCCIHSSKVLPTFLYIVFFPLICLVLLIWYFLIKLPAKILWNCAAVGTAILELSVSARFFTAACIVVGLTLTAIQRTTSHWVAYLSFPILGVLLIYFLLANFYWLARLGSGLTKTSSKALNKLNRELHKSMGKLAIQCKLYQSSRDKPQQAEAAKKIILGEMKQLMPLHVGRDAIEFLNNYMPMRAIVLFIFGVRFVVSLCAVLVIYAALYSAIDRVSSGSFQAGLLGSSIDAVYFSAANFTLNAHEGAVSAAARWLVLSQVFCGMIMFTGLVLSFSTVSVEVADIHQKRLAKQISEYFSTWEAVVLRFFDPGNLSLKEMGDRLDGEFDRFIRRDPV